MQRLDTDTTIAAATDAATNTDTDTDTDAARSWACFPTICGKWNVC